MLRLKPLALSLAALSAPALAHAEDGYDLWLRYTPAAPAVAADYKSVDSIVAPGASRPIIHSAVEELTRALAGLVGTAPRGASGHILMGTRADDPVLAEALSADDAARLGPEGFVIHFKDGQLRVAGGGDAGVLYGTFRLVQELQMGHPLKGLSIEDHPRVALRMVNHWDNPVIGEDGWSVERGYGGPSIFKWSELPETVSPRLHDYARLLAAMGINAACVNNGNTAKHGLEGWRLITKEWLPKVAAIASQLRPYGVRTYVAVSFFSPKLIGHLQTADPLDPAVQAWWKKTADDIYAVIPDFGGFVIKADSENEPGPYAYGRTHADGENMMAAALAPHGGKAIWRAFVYTEKGDRVTDAYRNFAPLEGTFSKDAIVEVKNGPLDFQIREPVSSLLAALPTTSEVLELQITQEYTGQDRQLCFLAPLWKEVFDFDTHAQGQGSTVESLVTDRLYPQRHSGVVGVMNIGSDRNWTGALLAQANTYAFGRLSWNPSLSPYEIADTWTRLTFGQDPTVVATVDRMLLASRGVFEAYTAPLGLGLLTERGNHFNPALKQRVNYTHADKTGVGYDRTAGTGSGYAGQYAFPWNRRYEDPATCPEDLLLFFHHVAYTTVLHSGKTLIQTLYDKHNWGAAQAQDFVKDWESLDGKIDAERYASVLAQLKDQASLAESWKTAFNGYFESLTGIPDASAPATP